VGQNPPKAEATVHILTLTVACQTHLWLSFNVWD